MSKLTIDSCVSLTLMDLEILNDFKQYKVEIGVFENFILCDIGCIFIFGRQRGLEVCF